MLARVTRLALALFQGSDCRAVHLIRFFFFFFGSLCIAPEHNTRMDTVRSNFILRQQRQNS